MATSLLTPVLSPLLSMAVSLSAQVDIKRARAAAPTKYDQVVTYIQNIAAQNPDTTKLIEVGVSDSGQKIYGLKIGNGSVNHLVVATHHGNEYGSTEVAKGVAASLAKDPLKDITVFVIPVLNIPGYNSNNRYEVKAGRYLDPNRDYPGPCGTTGPFLLKSTKALADFVAANNIVASATLHTFTGAVLYPWGISTHDLSTLYDSEFITLGNAAAVESKYEVGNSTALLYAADGTYDDYAFWKHGIWSLLFEMGTTHSPSTTQVQRMIAENVPGIRRFLEIAPKTVAPKHDFTGKCDKSVRRRTHLE